MADKKKPEPQGKKTEKKPKAWWDSPLDLSQVLKNGTTTWGKIVHCNGIIGKHTVTPPPKDYNKVKRATRQVYS